MPPSRNQDEIRRDKIPPSLVYEINELGPCTGFFSRLVTEETLVVAARRGDEKAFETLDKRHQPRIFAVALRYTRVHEHAEDVVQQTLEKAVVYLDRFEGKLPSPPG